MKMLWAVAVLLAALPSLQAQIVYGWGYNQAGSLGLENFNAIVASPTPIPSLATGVQSIETGFSHSLAIRNGGLVTWGRNDSGQVGNNATSFTGVATPYTSTLLTSNVTAVSGGFLHSLAIRNGAVYGWGNNQNREVGDTTTTQRNAPVAVPALTSGVTAISAGGTHSLAIRNGAAWYWGQGVNPVAMLSLASGVTAISAGNGSSLAIKDGAVHSFTSFNSTTTYASLASGVTDVAAGNGFNLALKQGVVYVWGSNFDGQLGNNGPANQPTPSALTSLPANIVDIEAGDATSYALTADGRLFAWGANHFGTIGNGTTIASSVPVEITLPAGYQFQSIRSDVGLHVFATVVPEPPLGVLALAVLALYRLRK